MTGVEQPTELLQVLDELIEQTHLDRGQPYWSDRLDWLDHVEQWLNSLKDSGWSPELRVARCLRCGLLNVTVHHICMQPFSAERKPIRRWWGGLR